MQDTYIADTVQHFFEQLDMIKSQLENFSANVEERRNNIFSALGQFESANKKLAGTYGDFMPANPVEKSLKETIEEFSNAIDDWAKEIEVNKKGVKFMNKHEKYLVVMVFGAVKSGKSSLGNFFAGRELAKAKFNNEYQQRKPVFETEEKGRNTGNFESDAEGNIWFTEGVTDTTGDIQYFTLSGLRWIDSPGTGAVIKDGDCRNMEEMVNEYIPYADLCIFLMNSSEPGLQADMKYIKKMTQKHQEALVVITKSDEAEEDEDENGEIKRIFVPKSKENRKLQEDDICERLQETYPEVPVEKFRAISVSTYIGKDAVEKNDSRKFQESGLDLLMQILGNKVSENAIGLKEKKPKDAVNIFIQSIIQGDESIKGIEELEEQLRGTLQTIEEFKESIEANIERITNKVAKDVRIKILDLTNQWDDEVRRTKKNIDEPAISAAIQEAISKSLQSVLKQEMTKILKNYKPKPIKAVQDIIRTNGISNQTEIIETPYTIREYVPRDPEGIIEHLKFWKTYYRLEVTKGVRTSTVDIGTNIDEFFKEIEPEVKRIASSHARDELNNIKETYFEVQEKYIYELNNQLQELKQKLFGLKFS